MHCDVVVIGAGPAGSTAARELSARGVSVVMLDKAVFPREKPCGGFVSAHCVDLIGVDLSSVIERTVTAARITVNRRKETELHRPTPPAYGYMTQRAKLDALLAEQAVRDGASFRQRARIRSIERDNGNVTVRTSDEVVHARVLVAADGANGPSARFLNIPVPDHNSSIALEGNITPQSGVPEEWESTIALDLGSVPGGYCWLFPKGDHLNLGLGGYKRVGSSLRAKLEDLAASYGYDPGELRDVRGHHVPQRRPDSPLVDGNVILVGDAAGLVDPMTGEGICAAVRSAQCAASRITEYLAGRCSGLDGYARDLQPGILEEIETANRFRDVFYGWPELFYIVEKRSPVLWRQFSRLFRGEVTYTALSRKLGVLRPVLRLASYLARNCPQPQRLARFPLRARH